MNQFENDVFHSLKAKYKLPEWVVLKQVKTNTGLLQSYGGARYVDFFIMNMYPSNNYYCIAIEAKQSISDLRADLQDANKQVASRFYSDEFFYLITKEMAEINREEIVSVFYSPTNKSNGLMVLDKEKNQIKFWVRHKHEKSPFSFGFVASLVRNSNSLE